MRVDIIPSGNIFNNNYLEMVNVCSNNNHVCVIDKLCNEKYGYITRDTVTIVQ